MIIYALQTVLPLNKKYLSDVQVPCTCFQNKLLNTLNKEKIRLNNANKNILSGCENISNTSVFFRNIKNWFYLKWYRKKPHLKN